MLAHGIEAAYGGELNIPCQCSYLSKVSNFHIYRHILMQSFKNSLLNE